MCLVHFYEERKMRAYSETYLDDVVESQGKLFDFVAQTFPENDTTDFIEAFMKSKTRKYIDESMAYVNTMDAKELWKYFSDTEKASLIFLSSGRVIIFFSFKYNGSLLFQISVNISLTIGIKLIHNPSISSQ